ncbi:DUF1292 domain-containing protein [Clostridium sp.]|uniref:DUF1292 domain-containing protein n=1 Tax=Clostridium sp. TaxID=1506 RepID=UPI0026DD02C9|nr:DUF1292 domain-containing protein [Clostridium sp.]MDO5038732.1 DUF1292 domain-containing protein [Clostridium sp.]
MDKELNKCGCGNHNHEGEHECCGGHHHDENHECCGGHGHHHEHGEGCGCGEDHHDHFVVDLVDDEGNTVSCPIIDAFQFEENEYVLAKNMDDDSVYLFRVSEENEELIVPDEAEFDKVRAYYEEVLAED